MKSDNPIAIQSFHFQSSGYKYGFSKDKFKHPISRDLGEEVKIFSIRFDSEK